MKGTWPKEDGSWHCGWKALVRGELVLLCLVGSPRLDLRLPSIFTTKNVETRPKIFSRILSWDPASFSVCNGWGASSTSAFLF